MQPSLVPDTAAIPCPEFLRELTTRINERTRHAVAQLLGGGLGNLNQYDPAGSSCYVLERSASFN